LIKRRNDIIISDSRICNSVFCKAIGFRFRKKPDYCLVFVFENPQKVLMDMWFVFYPIDVVLLDKEKKVIEIKENFLPFTFFASKKSAGFILEFNSGVVKKNNIMVGDVLDIS